MIKSVYLRNFIWITFISIIILNMVVFKNTFKILKNVKDKRSKKYFNFIFVLNLSLSDVIFGFTLAIIAFTSEKFSGVYCSKDLEWRSSLGCSVIGILTFISSQTSLNILVILTGFRLYTVYKPFKSLDIRTYKIYLLLFICWTVPLILSFIPVVFKKEFVQKMVISSNIFLSNNNVDRIIKSEDLYKLAENIETVWISSKTYSIPPSKRIYNIRDFSVWYFNSYSFRNQYPNTSIDIRKSFGFYGSSAVCLPDFYPENYITSKYVFALMSLNLILIIFISFGYALIFHKTWFSESDKLSQNRSKYENTMLYRVSLIVATDIACWLPIIMFSFAKFFGYQTPDIVHSLTSIVLLPINSLLNPIIYSKLDVIINEKLKYFSSIRKSKNTSKE